MKLAHLAIVAVCVGATGIAALRAEPGRQSGHPGKEGFAPQSGGPTSKPARSDNRPPRGDVPDEEVQAAMDFLTHYSPKRAALVSRLVGPGQRTPFWRRQVVTRWREMKQLQASDPEMYEIKLRLMTIEDNMFGEAMAAKKDDGSPSHEEHVEKLRAFAAEFVRARNEERAQLIKKLQASIAADTANPGDAINARVDFELNSVNRERGDGFQPASRFDAAAPPPGGE